MNLFETVAMMRARLMAAGVTLTPDRELEEGPYDGPGDRAMDAWRVFREVAVLEPYDPVEMWEETHPVSNGGLQFEAGWSDGWPKNPHNEFSVEMPSHFELMFRRQYAIGDAGDMQALDLTIFIEGAEELRELEFSDLQADDPAAEGRTELVEWLDEIEALDEFRRALAHRALRFSFGMDGVG